MSPTAHIRKFGLTLLAVCGSLLALAIWRDRRGSQIFFALMSGFGLLFAMFPSAMAPVHSVWHKVGQGIGQAVTYIAMTLIYFLVISPYALALWVFGRKPIPTTLDRSTSSYWAPRESPIQPRERMLRRF